MRTQMDQQDISNALDNVLAQLYRLNAQTQKCRWKSTHGVFDMHYSMLDQMSEQQIRAISDVGRCFDKLGVSPSKPLNQFFEAAAVDEVLEKETSEDMLESLLDSQKRVAQSAEKLLLKVDIENDMIASLATNQYLEAEKGMVELRDLMKQPNISARIEVS